MEKTFRTTAIALKRKDWRETDSLFTLYTEDYGKLNVVAVGSRKIKSKLIGHLSTYGLVDVMVAKGKRQDKLATARLIENLNIDLEKDYYYLNIIFEALDKALAEGQADHRIWELVNNCIKWLKLTTVTPQKNIVISYFIIQLIREIGYSPDFTLCGRCQTVVTAPKFFGLAENSVTCDACSGEKISFSTEFVSLFKILLDNNLANFQNLTVKRSVIDEGLIFIKNWSAYVLEKEINSLNFI